MTEWDNANRKKEAMVAYIDEFIKTHGYSPTLKEIRKAVRQSSASVTHYWISKLEKEGRIERTHNMARNIRIKDRYGSGNKMVRFDLESDDALYVIIRLSAEVKQSPPDMPDSRLERIVKDLKRQYTLSEKSWLQEQVGEIERIDSDGV